MRRLLFADLSPPDDALLLRRCTDLVPDPGQVVVLQPQVLGAEAHLLDQVLLLRLGDEVVGYKSVECLEALAVGLQRLPIELDGNLLVLLGLVGLGEKQEPLALLERNRLVVSPVRVQPWGEDGWRCMLVDRSRSASANLFLRWVFL